MKHSVFFCFYLNQREDKSFICLDHGKNYRMLVEAVQIKEPKRASDWHTLDLFFSILVNTIYGLKLLVYIVINHAVKSKILKFVLNPEELHWIKFDSALNKRGSIRKPLKPNLVFLCPGCFQCG